LLDAAVRAIRHHGPTVSMDRIAAEAGIAKPILYRHFGDKAGLHQLLAGRRLQELMHELQEALAVERDPRERLQTTIDTYLRFVERDPELYRFLLQPTSTGWAPGSQAAVGDFIRRVGDEVAAVLRVELERVGLDPSPAGLWGHAIVGMVQQAGDWWLDFREMSREQLVDRLVGLLWSGFDGLGRPLADGRTEGSSPLSA
jgi:AcrR family transcriptional regulator